MYFYGIDVYYIVLVVPALVFAMWAQMRVSSAFNRYSQLRTGAASPAPTRHGSSWTATV